VSNSKSPGFFKNIAFFIKNKWAEPGNRIFFFLFVGVVLFGILMFFIESIPANEERQINNIFDSIWWLFVTITTVGYGDIVPTSSLGKIVGILTVFAGVTFFSVFSGSIASFLVEVRIKERRGLGEVNFKDHILILGWNNNLEKIISSLPVFLGSRNFNLVLVNDGTEEDYDEIKSKFLGYNIRFIHGDFTKENVLRRANIEDCRSVVILADTYGQRLLDEADERTLYTVLTIKAVNPEIKIFAEVIKSDKAKNILRAGADNVILNGEFNPIIISGALSSPAMPDFIRALIANYEEPKIRMAEIPRQFIGKTFKELFAFFREKNRSMVVGLLATEKELTIDDLLSSDNAIDAFIRAKFSEVADEFEKSEEKHNVKINPDDGYVIREEDSFAFVIY
jgi:voltage-gated potassium channel